MRAYVKTHFNEEVAIVFGTILDLVEPSLRTLDQTTSTSIVPSPARTVAHVLSLPDMTPVTASSVLTAISRLDPVPDLSNCFGRKPKSKDCDWSVQIPTDAAGVIQQIMLLLADRGKEMFGGASVRGLERQFLTEWKGKDGGSGSRGGGGGGKWQPDFEELGARIRRRTVEILIRDQLDSVALKCWKILEEKGKLDEKHVCCSSFPLPQID